MDSLFSKEELELLKGLVESETLRMSSWRDKIDKKIYSRLEKRNNELADKLKKLIG